MFANIEVKKQNLNLAEVGEIKTLFQSKKNGGGKF